jgi:hypothetical protein
MINGRVRVLFRDGCCMAAVWLLEMAAIYIAFISIL